MLLHWFAMPIAVVLFRTNVLVGKSNLDLNFQFALDSSLKSRLAWYALHFKNGVT